MRVIVTISCILTTFFTPASSIEPISTSIALASSFFGYKYFDTIKLNTYCKYRECCNSDVIPHDIISLKEKMDANLFGQHIVNEKIFKAVASHYEKINSSKKALVMIFHGTQGTGKNYVANMIAEAVFEKGVESKHYHLFHGSQYSNNDRVWEYQAEIKKEIEDAIDSCPYSIFVFDEADKCAPKIFDGIKNFLDHHKLVRGRDLTKAIFIFLTNYGGDEISTVLYKLVAKEGLFRHEVMLHHFEEIMKLSVFNKEGGMKDTELIKSAVIDFYIPFLPLEEKHVIDCIRAEFKSCLGYYPRQEAVNEVLKYIGFNSITKFSHTGCKTVYAKVQAECYG